MYVPVAFPPSMLKKQCFCVSLWSGTWLYAYFRSIFEKYSVPELFFSSLIFLEIVSIRWSMLCIWYLFLWNVSFIAFESNAILIALSFFTVITTGMIKYSSEHFSNLIICLSSISFSSSFSTFSIRCIGFKYCLNVDLATWFLDLRKRLHKWRKIFVCYFFVFCWNEICIFLTFLRLW